MAGLRLLYSARDPGAVGHVVALTDAFRRDGRCEVTLVASGAALEMLRAAGASPRPFLLPGGSDHVPHGGNPARLLREARRLVEALHPDVILASLSSYGVGVDEALLATANVPTFAMQDFWGDVNLGLGVPARCYFVLDETAVELSQRRWGVHAVPVGSPKHARYADLDIGGMRAEGRRRLGVDSTRPVVGFFGQAPGIPGHEEAFEVLIRALRLLGSQALLVLRDHRKFPPARPTHDEAVRSTGLAVVDVTEDPAAETWLAACDVVTTCFSSCALDHAYLSAYASEPIGTVVYLLVNDAIRAAAEESCGLAQFPTVDLGLGVVAHDAAGLPGALAKALAMEPRLAYHTASRRLSTQHAAQTVVDMVVAAARAGHDQGESVQAASLLPDATGGARAV